jgi:beta-glucosidase/6-phospho-beta-glucosidase/beta-galactosidase
VNGGEKMFPKDFLFGASLSGFQFEMGMNDVDENTDWYHWVRDMRNVLNGVVSGDLPENGADYWNKYEKVHSLAKDFDMNVLRIGIEWSRIFPESTEKVDYGSENMLQELDELANHDALEHYRKIMEDIKEKGLKLFLNLNHFTLPIWLHDPIKVLKGEEKEKIGWVKDNAPIEFAKFAEYVAWKFSDIVDLWSTMNEPNIVGWLGYLSINAGFPPSYFSPDWFVRSFKNQAKAHNLGYDAIKKYTDKPVGIIYSFSWVDTLKDDEEIFEKAMYYENWYFMDMVKERLDFIGVNYYTRKVVDKIPGFELAGFKVDWRILPGYGYGCPEKGFSKIGRPASDFGWEIYPEGLYKMLKQLYDRYSKPLIVTENGIADEIDRYRAQYLISHLYAVEKALGENVELWGYLHWSIIDNYEWAKGYSKRFGLAYTDFERKEYIPRPSMYIYKDIISKKTTEHFRKFDPFGIMNF